MRVPPGSKVENQLEDSSGELLVASEANQNLRNLTAYLSRDLDSRGVFNPMDVAKEIRLLRKDWSLSPQQIDDILSEVEV